MIFINPRTDFAFKKIFGSEHSQPILVSFLNGILHAGEPVITELTILNPYQAPRIRGVKETYLDVKARLRNGEWVIIEMQVLNVEGFEKRILYNAAKAYSVQLASGAGYPSLNPVIALTITDFEMFPEIKPMITRFVLKEKMLLLDYPIDDLELVFLELPKFQQDLTDESTLTEQWIYFLQHAQDLRTVPMSMERVPELQQAFELANQASLSREELDELEHQEIFIQDQRGAISKARKEGLEQGIEQGLEQGIEQGRRETQRAIARQLLSTMDDVAIAQLTNLPVDEIQALRSPR
jgi:predicted transposase/invertase (TIGR01784 family)